MSSILWGTGVGTWEWNVQTRRNPLQRALGGDPRLYPGRTAADHDRHLERPCCIRKTRSARRSSCAVISPASASITNAKSGSATRTGTGSGSWTAARVTARDRDGKPLWMAGTHLEIGKRKAAEEKLAHYQQNLERPGRAAHPRPVARQGSGGSCQPRQDRLSGQCQPRVADTDARHHGHADAGHAPHQRREKPEEPAGCRGVGAAPARPGQATCSTSPAWKATS